MNVSLGLVKTAADAHAERLLAREARWLRELEGVPALEGQVPRVLEEGRSAAGWRYLVISAPPPAAETRAFTSDHARFLASLGKARFRALDFEVTTACRRLQRSLERVRAFAAPRAAAVLEGAYRDCESALFYWTGPYVLSQGDFAPWHVRYLGSQLFVTEWGEARAEASPLDDVLHYLMIQRALGARPLTLAALRESMACAADFAARAYPEWSWRAQVIGALTLVYLLGVVLHRSLARGRIDRSERVLGAYWKLVEKRAEWLAEPSHKPIFIPGFTRPTKGEALS